MGNNTNINVRRVAFDIVLSVTEDGQFLNEALSDTLQKYQYIEKNRRSFISYLSKGVIERYIEMDAVISAYSSTKINKLNSNIRNTLRMAIYELRYMDSVPESATCNEYVKLTGKVAPSRLKGFVNGILRNMIRDNFSKVSLEPYEKYSLPKWLYDMLNEEYGNADEMAEAFLNSRGLTIRTNLTKCTPKELADILDKEGIKAEPIPAIDYAFSIKGIDYLEGLESFKKGLFYVQDVSSMMVGIKSEVKAGDTVIDVCAAPGGKSIHIAELMTAASGNSASESNEVTPTTGRVLSYDISSKKVALITENVKRTGLDNITAEVGDATVYNDKLCETADIVIADVPCSGIGVIGKKPDIKIRINIDDIDNLADLQYKIIQNVKKYVKAGGTLIYSTCTVSKKENELNVAKFLKDNNNFKLIEEKQYFPTNIQDGFYIAVLKKEMTRDANNNTNTADSPDTAANTTNRETANA